jgi:hypothetical protein
MPAIICKANFNTTCPRKLQGDLQNAEFVAGFQFREECFLLQLKRGPLAAKIAVIHFETPEIA